MRLTERQAQALYSGHDLECLASTGYVAKVHGRRWVLTDDGTAEKARLEREHLKGNARRAGQDYVGRRFRVRGGFPLVRGLWLWRRVPRRDLPLGHVWFHTDDLAEEFVHLVGGRLEP